MSASDSLSFALGQISSAVKDLNKKTYKLAVAEIHELIEKHGFEAERHFFQVLFSSIDFSADAKNSGKDYQQVQFLTQECQTLIVKPNFPSILCYAFENPDQKQKTLKPSTQLLPNVSRTLKLNKVQEVVFGLGLLKSANEELKTHAGQFVKQKLPDLLRSYIDTDTGGGQEGGLSDIAIEVLHCLLTHVLHGPRELVGVGEDQINAFLDTLRRDFPKERVPVVLAPLLYPNAPDLPANKLVPDSNPPVKVVTEDDLAELMKEIGYVCCQSIEDCRNTLVQFGLRDIKPAAIARAIGMMVKTAYGLAQHIPLQNLNSSASALDKKPEDENQLSTWNIEIFVQVVKELFPGLNWAQVILDLDYPGFQVPSGEGLKILMEACSRGLQEGFPVEVLYRTWTNTEGQLSWILQLLTHADLFCFTDYPCEAVMLDTLKILPEEETREISNWKSLTLVETLLRLSEAGHYESVKSIFSFPFKNCPDILFFALLQAKPTWNTLSKELLLQLVPIFLSNHPNAASVLQYAWNGQSQSISIRQIIMQAMADWYMKGDQDQARLSRILDVAQDLKALSVLLNFHPLLFVIDLAALASRREYLKLDKWLNDKLREHQEKFAEAMITFLKRRCPHLTGITLDKELPKSIQLPTETVIVMLTCLSNIQVPPSMADVIRQMIANHGPLTKPRPTPQAIGGALLKRQGSLDSALPTPLTSQVDPLPGLGLSHTTSTPNSQLPSFPPHPLSIPTSNLGAVGSIGSGLTQPIQKPSSTSQFSHLGIQPPATSNSGLGSSQSHIFQQLQQAGLGGTLSGSNTDSYRMLSGLNSHKPLGSSLLNQQQQQVMMAQQHRTPTPEKLRQAPTDVSQVWPGMDQSFSKEVEDEANSYFQRIYNHPPNPTISIDEVLEMLKKFKDSPIKKERDIFLCMLRNLFEEYRFFPQYPDKELHTTACLFGGIIEQGLVTYMALGIALRYVLDALRKTYNSKMYMFGIAALDRFKTRLKDYPHYCQHLASIPHFRDFPSSLIEYIEYGQQSKEPPLTSRTLTQDQQASAWLSNMDPMASRLLNRTSLGSGSASPTFTTTAVGKPGQTSGTSSGSPSPKPSLTSSDLTSGTARGKEPSIANASNIDTLLGASEKNEIAQPPEHVQDKIHFIFNNISQSNLNTKAEEFKNAVQSDFLQWVAQYMVMKRASIEPNFHQLYIDFMDALDSMPDFAREITKETFRNIKVLLQSEKVPANFSDRSLLKNLGHWLGLLTLARNRPILMRDLDLKSLVIEAYFKGQQDLLYVVPFVAKVMESAAKSKVFKPPNPWIMAIMALLVELHQVPDLKLNLKFEVEVLCNTLSLDMKDIKPTELLRDTDKFKTIPQQLASPEKEKLALSTTPSSGTTTATTAGTQPSQTATPPPPQYAYHEINVSGLSGLAPHIQINPQIPLFQQNPHLKQFVRPSIERAVQELVHPVVERSIKICLTTAEMIVKKDFALDPEESRMRAAAHHMVRFMTAGMALITCRDPLLVSITNTLRSSLQTAFRSANQQQKEMIEHAATVVSEENTELACSFIQKTAVEKVLPEMDKRLATEFDVRRHARSEGRRYCDPMILTYQAERMPEQIRLKVGGVNPNQTAVYEEFARSIPGFKVPPSGETLPMPPLSKPMYDHGILSSEMRTESLGNIHSRQKASIPPPIHEDFRSVDKFSLDSGAFQGPFPQAMMPEEVVQILNKCAAEIEQHLHAIMAPPSSPPVMTIHSLLDAVVQTRNSRDNNAAVRLLHKAVEGLLDEVTPLPSDQELALRFRDCHLIVLRGLQDPRGYGINWTSRHVTKFVCDCVPELKFNVEAIDLLIRGHLINMREFDQHIVQCMDNGLNVNAVHFAIQLVKYVSDDKHAPHVSEGDLSHTIESLTRMAHSRQNPEGLSSVLESVHNGPSSMPSHHDVPDNKAPGGPTSLTTNAVPSFSGFEDPPGLHEKVEYLLREWVRLCHQPGAGKDSEKAFSTFVAMMHQQGILRSDDLITRFFRICTELCVDVTYRAIADHPNNPTLARSKCFNTLDAYCRLIALLVRHSGDASNNVTKINLLNRVLSTVATVLFQDHELRHTDFQQLPYQRIFIMLLLELNQPEPVLEAINFQVLQTFSTVFHALKPSRAPGFAYAWLELISHRLFMSKLLLNTPQQKGWSLFQQLLIDLFKFLAPFLRNAELAKQTHLLYKGTLRVLLVLLHDFPEFLCDYHFSFCDVIPPNCIQMRNLILSAFPRNMRLPDPFTPNLKVDLLTDIAHSPRILTNFGAAIQPATFKKDLDSYLKTRTPVTFLTELRSHLQVSTEPGTRYNVPLMNALVLYVGTQAIAYIHSKSGTPSMSTITHSSHMDIFQNLAVDLDTEGRYLFLNAIANQLRYPNSHTHYFSCVLLYLFAEANTEAIQEQITRVLLERLIVNRPHPWGLLITFIELIKNHQYKFWTHEFVHCAPEIEKLFESVARSCMQQKQVTRESTSEGQE
ncbi:CCR4-NOT transcription complex subunit 1-like isoform X2 [Actinia tenebrosa]|uniref:CCR4-NOT transcription complex subunit 1 n=1 Tax=Actinia tenebrosa TaxID=6105 RepID=A0A6P8HZN0_ACTTE|nr:CCR4-NOT transcription complex subunit 1-like isoform X2 [Actinia tenebrosa]